MAHNFDYDLAFSRNIGWVTQTEQDVLKNKRVAIAGMGGVGGSHLLALVRLGITQFNLADFDVFNCENTNRQVGASTSTYGKKKLETMIEMAKDINPEIEVRAFPEGVTKDNVDAFLEGCDCYVDALDFFVLDIRRLVFSRCRDGKIPATTAAPIGFGTAYINFLPDKMSFDTYFDFKGDSENEQYLKFYLGLTPSNLQRHALVDATRVDLANKKGPSNVAGCQLAAGVVVAQVAKILLNRGPIICAPYSLHFDAFSNKLNKVWRPFGNRNPIQKLAFKLAKKQFSGLVHSSQNNDCDEESGALTLACKVIELAKWAPSGDNCQPWQFELLDATTFNVHANNTRASSVYDLDGHSSHIAHGILLETIEIAASKFGCRVEVHVSPSNGVSDIYKISLIPSDAVIADPLLANIKTRTVQRKAMGTRALSEEEKRSLVESLPPGFKVQWYQSTAEKRRFAWLNAHNAKTRLTMKEAYLVHAEIIDWGKQFSETKIPEQALGLDKITARLTHWLFESWERVAFFNRYLFGTVAPRLQLDFIPGMRASCHFTIHSEAPIENRGDYVAAGRAIQRFWLKTDQLQLGLQPSMTPLIFARYLESDIAFTESRNTAYHAFKSYYLLKKVVKNHNSVVFMGRLGRTNRPLSRSVRKSLSALLFKSA
ncbi:ThiF family adenylyltransferase [Pseudoalteromonas sp. SMS1]|uniref:ThiF family adenylyltransferase n=1 Tax=Pseudoalteromonas sp. SMS1 TaxID=2908894 RepID=UPI001F2508AD|nr:ThiF family adenylyltransferase [Pseudoalteromonas sp. SMS1]MCF2857243.1 ThiF family adenylyltransferase [Pseudoalteromonas sp. SMS1]